MASTRTSRPLPFRRATRADADALLELERSASLAALGHVFPPERFPYPSGDVLARWHLVLADADVVVEVLDGEGGLACVVAHDPSGAVRQLAVAPDLWGRGLGAAALDHAVAALRALGVSPPDCGAWPRTPAPAASTSAAVGGSPAPPRRRRGRRIRRRWSTTSRPRPRLGP